MMTSSRVRRATHQGYELKKLSSTDANLTVAKNRQNTFLWGHEAAQGRR